MMLVVNADDFGLCRGVNLGIVEAFQKGVVRSTTMMTTMPGVEDATRLAQENPGLGIGVHLTLTAGKPITGSNVLADDVGNFFRSKDMVMELPAEAIEKEFICQIERFLKLGLQPTHLDSHHHVHKMNNVFDAFAAVASRYDLPVRLFTERPVVLKSTERFDGSYYCRSEQDNMEVSRIQKIIEQYRSEPSLEIMVHPAFIDQALVDCSTYLLPRAKELATLCDPVLREWLDCQGITLCHFGQI